MKLIPRPSELIPCLAAGLDNSRPVPAHARDFEYDLPDPRIARRPAEPRESCRLLAYDRSTGEIADRIFTDLQPLLRPGDALVLNDAAVRRARLFAARARGGRSEIFLLDPLGGDRWHALVRPAKKTRVGETLTLEDGAPVRVLEKHPETGFVIALPRAADEMEKVGHVPLPPYMTREDDARDRTDYQTVFAGKATAVAAPTAGLHFSRELLGRIAAAGVEIVPVNLAVGLGTFRPLPDLPLSEITLHREGYEISPPSAATLNRARREGRRLVAVGTTVCRVLESELRAADEFRPGAFSTDLFLKPGDEFRAVGALVTNFHAPGSSLLCLVEAFLQQKGRGPGAESRGSARWRALYEHALAEDYRFLSYGDAMLIA